MNNIKIEWINEDELPDIPNNVYSVMFNASRVSGTRYFPYVLLGDGKKYYLIELDGGFNL